MADIVGPLIEIVNCLSTPTCTYVDHYRKFNGDVNGLRDKLEDLNGRKQDIESRLQVEVHVEETVVKEEVQLWIKRVQTINDEVQAILGKARRVKWYRKACLGKDVRRKIDEVKEIYKQGSFTGGLVIASAGGPGIILPTEDLEGEKSVKEKLRKYLMDDEVGIIGVCWIGGVGKTTIMKHVNNELLKEDRFQKVIWVTVSYPLNVLELQKKIALAMGKTLREDEEEMMRARKLMDIMERVRFLLILDDVWEIFSLSDVGIREPTRQNRCKVVITSRSIEVCNFLGCEIVKVQPLSPGESLNLFLNKVGHDVLQVAGLKEILKLIVEECAGLPLAIVVIAGGMRGEYDIIEWRNALNELRQCVKSAKGMEDEIFRRLKFSYDRLKSSEIQKCFLYCSLFREDYEFFRKELIESWIDEGLIDESGRRQEAYDRGHVFLNRLEKNCLLEKTVGGNGYGYVFKMHDVVRDMAIKSIGVGFGYMVKAGMNLKKVPNESEWVRDLKKVSLRANGISKIPVGLILSNNADLAEIPSSFFEDMIGLKVLDLSGTGIEALPDSISNLVNLSALRLRECRGLKYLPSFEKLVALKKLDLHRAGIEVVPKGMAMLVSLEYLDLFCPKLKEIPMGILPSLLSLQYLVVYPSSAIIRRINLEEVVRLSNLGSLECGMGGIQDFNYLVNKSEDFESLTAYDLRLTTGKQDITAYAFSDEYQRKVLIFGCEIGEECIVLPDKLEDLWINHCKNMKNMRCSSNKAVLLENATELRKCLIWDFEGIECMVELDSSSSSLSCPVLDKLEELYIRDSPNLSALVRVEGVAKLPLIFSNLKSLLLHNCLGMTKLLPFELLQALQNLEEIWISGCEQMEEIIASSDSDASSDIFSFPKLRKLRLNYLPQLKNICSGKGVCDSIEEITIHHCRKLKRIPLQFPLLDNGQPVPPPHLREINIDEQESKEWWESLKWDHPNAQNMLQPFLKLHRERRYSGIDEIEMHPPLTFCFAVS
ncbi:hypothetical protein SLEP1_g27030 [Rubroshorea leprosula]|uniref:NB-ARC domain-containing protein n=1 Tax=Rubroshorea leprosula TaxID=152421 RepID=A0AAV5JYF4_9ROSI|nr:hypothetical protein SLEP1_g27030 [Rubroshorea leprosula]